MTEPVMLAWLTFAGLCVVGIAAPLTAGWIARRAILTAKAASEAATALIQAEMAALAKNMDGHMSKIIAMSEQAARDAGEVGGRDKEIAAQDARTSRVAGLIQEVGAKVDAVAAVVVNGVPTAK